MSSRSLLFSRYDPALTDWLDNSLSRSRPIDGEGFLFSVTQGELCRRLEVTGTENFHSNSHDWPWSENWSPDEPPFNLPEVAATSAQIARFLVADFLKRYIDCGLFRTRLTMRAGIGLDTLDRYFDIIYQAPETISTAKSNSSQTANYE